MPCIGHMGQWLPQELQARRETLRHARQRLQQQIDRLTDAYVGEVLSLAEYHRRRLDLEQKQQALTVQETQLGQHVDRQKEIAAVAATVTEFCARISAGLASATFAQKRQLVELLIDRVIVANGAVEIHYVVPTVPSSEQVRFCHLRSDYFYSADFHCRRLVATYIAKCSMRLPIKTGFLSKWDK